MHPEDFQAVDDAFQEFLTSDRAVLIRDYRFRRADGTYIWLVDRAFALRNEGVVQRIIGSVHDVSVRKQAERMKSDFVSFVSHQLRTPLSGMNWMLELARGTPNLPDDARRYIVEAEESVHRLVALVNDLLDISQLESGRLTSALEPVQLPALTRAVLEDTRSLIEQKGHRLVIDVPELSRLVQGDLQLLRQVVLNLVSNAIKYTPSGGTIAIRLTETDGVVRWTVTDSGIGVPKASQAHLFEKFFRADNAVLESDGTGLGLHLVRLIVEQFGGQVWCESEEGQGATFGFSMPVMEAV